MIASPGEKHGFHFVLLKPDSIFTCPHKTGIHALHEFVSDISDICAIHHPNDIINKQQCHYAGNCFLNQHHEISDINQKQDWGYWAALWQAGIHCNCITGVTGNHDFHVSV
jgi:hypothetical protein